MTLLPLIHGKKCCADGVISLLKRWIYRGTGNTLPFSCTDNDLETDDMLNELILGNSSDVALGRLWTRGAINAELCFQKSNETGGLIGTAFVARDLIRAVDALEEDEMLRYWGK